MRFGTHAVEEALRAGNVRRLLLLDGYEQRPRLAALAALARDGGIEVQSQPVEALDASAAGERHQGAIAIVAPFRYWPLDELLRRTGDEPPLFLALDGVEDPQNLGAILRSADAAGAHGVILPERRAAAVTPAVARASAGAVDHVAVAQVTNLVRALQELKQAGVWVYGLDMEGTEPYDEVDYTRPVCVVSGAEGSGLGRLVRETCDRLVRIPLAGHVESLNVSVATSLALFAARRARDRAPEV